MMELFSLEDDDYGDLFITQKSNDNDSISDLSGIRGDSVDIPSPHVVDAGGSGNLFATHYSNISDDDAFEVPSSQQAKQDTRSVIIK